MLVRVFHSNWTACVWQAQYRVLSRDEPSGTRLSDSKIRNESCQMSFCKLVWFRKNTFTVCWEPISMFFGKPCSIRKQSSRKCFSATPFATTGKWDWKEPPKRVLILSTLLTSLSLHLTSPCVNMDSYLSKKFKKGQARCQSCCWMARRGFSRPDPPCSISFFFFICVSSQVSGSHTGLRTRFCRYCTV